MGKIADKDIPTLSKVIKSAIYCVKKKPLWTFLSDEYNIGCMDGRFVNLTREDHTKIRELVLSQTSIDLLEPLPSGNRIEIAKQTGNEKFGADNPGRHHIQLSGCAGRLNLNGQSIPLLPGSSYRVDWRLITIDFPCIVVVENLMAFDHFYLARLPDELVDAWVVYRGHNISSQAVKEFLSAVPGGTPIVAFSDYDPAGLIISKTTVGVTHFLLPDIEAAFQCKTGTTERRAKGTRERYENQHASVTHLENNPLPAALEPHWMRLKHERLCVSQEQMLALSMPLLLIPYQKLS